jgi:hypothetical protein
VVKADGSWPRGDGFKPWNQMLASYYIKGKIEKEVSPNVHTQKKFNKNKISKVCA